jgi:hypothetical protein
MKEVIVTVVIKLDVDDTKKLGDISDIVSSIEENFQDFMGHCPYNNTSIKTTWDYNLKE